MVARREDDPEASNFSGKTWLLSAVRFALFGTHPADREDELVTRGEREGGVVLTLSDGLTVERSRDLGASKPSTQLVVGGARGKDAQQLVERRVGLGEADFLAAAFFVQKAMARFVDARPSERSAEVSAWLRLDAFQRMHKRVSASATELDREAQRLAGREETLRGRLHALSDPKSAKGGPSCGGVVRGCGLAGCPTCSSAPDPLAHSRAVVGFQARKADVASQEARAGEEELRALQTALGQAQAVRHGDQLRAEIAALEVLGDAEPDVDGPRTRAEAATYGYKAAATEAQRKRALARGGFSGVCPVNGGGCPIADELNADRDRNAVLAEGATCAERGALQVLTAASADLERAQGALDALRARRTRLTTLREQLARIEASTPLPAPGTAIPDAGEVHRLQQTVRMLQEVERAARASLDWARAVADEVARLSSELEQVADTRAELAARVRTHREAAAVLGRNGVQRMVAEGALREVQACACDLLAEAGVDLRVSLAWDRPTDQLSPICDACDQPYPPSRKVKACLRCGAPRGPKMAEGLEVSLSRPSGGFAADAAGIALSLAAGAWLRRERDVQWPVLCADEPFAAADPKNRRALLNLFRAAARRCGISQMFLVAHSDALMDSLPGRIEVVAGPDGSRASVVG